MRHDGDHAADPPAKKGTTDDGVTGGILGWAKSIVEKLLPNVPPVAAGILVLVVFGVAVVVVIGAFASNVVVGAVVLLVVVGVVGYVLLLRSGRRPEKPAHSDTLALAAKMKRNPVQHDAVCEIVGHAVADVADVLGANPSALRGNVFGCDENGTLRIMPEFDHNMNVKTERTLSMPIGQGSNGRAWTTGRPNVAVLRGDWGDNALPFTQQKKLAPDLSWVISVPVFPPQQPPPPTWVLNVDGVGDARTSEELHRAVGSVLLWAEQMGRVISEVGD